MFLDEILRYKRIEVNAQKTAVPRETLEKQLSTVAPARPFAERLTGGPIKLIAEVKKASPSKGLLCPHFDPESLATGYEHSGAAAISVLTDERFFQGSLGYLQTVKRITRKTPVLRKDFIIDPYQVMETRVAGADAVLLIVAALTKNELRDLIRQAVDLTLTPLVEVHHHIELETALEAGAKVVGINNRDLHTFKVDLDTTFELAKFIPQDIIVVSESGIQTNSQIQKLAETGVHAVLVGESLVTAPDPGMKIKELMGAAS